MVLKNFRSFSALLLSLVLGISHSYVYSQTHTDGPIQLQVKLREINTTAHGVSVAGYAALKDHPTYNVYAEDQSNLSGLNWPGATCLQDDYYFPGPSIDFNTTLFNFTYPTNVVPAGFGIKMFVFDDVNPSDGILGFCQNGTRCGYDPVQCCGVPVFGVCVGIQAGDENLCDASSSGDFIDNLNYRLGPPCEWYDFGQITGACAVAPNANYLPHIQSYWRYTRGYGCGDAIDLGTMCQGSTIMHFNSNECYTNTWTQSPGNDVTYTFNICNPIGITASLCGPTGAQFNSVLYLLDQNCNVITMNTNGCGGQSELSTYLCAVPGPYYLVVDGVTAADVGTFTLTLTENTALTFVAAITKEDVTCNGANNGKAFVAISGGDPPYTSVQWSNGASNIDSITGLAPSPPTYGVTITDSHGCTTSSSTTITQPPPIGVNMSFTPVSCSGYKDGTATAIPTGGVPPYRYFWYGAPPQVSQTAIDLPAGSITVYVADSNNCVFDDSITVTTTSIITNTLNSMGNVTCFGANNGFINITIGGGTPNYIYNWSGPNGFTSIAPNLSGLAPGTYSLTVNDQHSCNVISTYNITEPPRLTVVLNDSANARCNGGSDGAITVIANGGIQPYTYSWSSGQTTADLLNVPAGPYSITVTDSNLCTAILSHTITEPQPINLNFIPANPSCNGDSSGSINLNVTGGTQPYTYLWTNNATTANIAQLPAGAYGVLVTDSNNCFKFQFSNLTTPPPVSIQLVSVSNVNCNGASTGAININVTGGTPGPAAGYNYNWAGPNGYTNNIQNLSGLVAGSYSVTVSDPLGCSDTLTVIVTQVPPLIVTLIKADSVTCAGSSSGAIDIDVTGGVQPYSFSWSNAATTQDLFNISAATYTVTVTDGNSCTATLQNNVVIDQPLALSSTVAPTNPSCFGVQNGAINLTVAGGTTPYTFAWNNGATTQSLANLAGGSYSLLITDIKGCNLFDTITLVADAAVTTTSSITDLFCHGTKGGQITLNVTGGTTPYAYSWSGPNGFTGTTNPITGLSGGSYTASITDSRGCMAFGGPYTVKEPDSIAMTLTGTNVLCYGYKNGAASPLLSGGTPGYTYLWSNGQTGSFATGLDPVTYTLTVTDANNCTSTGSVTIGGPQQLVASVDNTSKNICFGDSTGQAHISATGGTRPYQYSVLNNVSQSSGDFTGLRSGNYTAVVLDSNYCHAAANFTILEPGDWSVTFKEPYVFVTRGTGLKLSPVLSDSSSGPYTYSWDPADGLSCTNCSNPKASPAQTSTYTVTVVDANGCSHIGQVAVVVLNEYDIYYPNAFSPNGDGKNDTWAPLDFGSTQTVDIRIFNRWGEMVYETADIAAGWDGTYKGTPLLPETYVYVVTGTFKNGKPFSNEGAIILMR